MSTLVVASTQFEVAESIKREVGVAVEGLGVPGTILRGKRCDFLITGVGQLQCGVHVSRALSGGSYSLAIQAGIGGSFTTDLPIGSAAVVHEEVLSDLGAEDHGTFLDLFDMGLLGRDAAPFKAGRLVASPVQFKALESLPRVRGVTVNRVLSEDHSIAWVRERYNPQVVSMEGAAFLYACLLTSIPSVSIRTVSDMVGPRDKGAWRIPDAVRALEGVLRPLLEECA